MKYNLTLFSQLFRARAGAAALALVGLFSFFSAPGLASEGLRCSDLFSEAPSTVKPFKFKQKLLEKGLDLDKISFKVTNFSNSVTIALYYEKVYSGQVKALYMKYGDHFESHISIENPELRGKGLGLLLYVAVAKELLKTHQALLLSSGAPSPAADTVWTMIVQNGWGKVHDFPDFRQKRYYFDPEVLSKNFDDVSNFVHSRPVNP